MTRAIRTPLAAEVIIFVSILLSSTGFAQAPPELKAKFDAKVKDLERFSTDPQVVSAVKSYNGSTPSAEAKTMTNDQWRALPVFASGDAQESQKAANQLAEMAAQLRTLVGQFKIKPAAPVADNLQTALI